jgi:hypothetical protein
VVDTHHKGFRARFKAAAERREHELRERLAAAGVDTLELGTDDDLADALLRFAELRKQRSRLANGTAAHHRSRSRSDAAPAVAGGGSR